MTIIMSDVVWMMTDVWLLVIPVTMAILLMIKMSIVEASTAVI